MFLKQDMRLHKTIRLYTSPVWKKSYYCSHVYVVWEENKNKTDIIVNVYIGNAHGKKNNNNGIKIEIK